MSTFNAGAIEANLTLGRSSWNRDLKKTQKEIADLEKKSITVGVDLDDTNARIALDNLELMLDDLDSKTYQPDLDADTSELNATLDAIDERLDALDDRRVVVEILADTDNAQVSLDNLENDLFVLDKDPVSIAIDVVTREADAILDALEARLDALEARKITVEADADIDNAMVALDTLEQEMNLLESDGIDITADADTTAAEVKLLELSLQMQRMSINPVDINVDLDGYPTAIAQMNTLEAQVAILNGQDIDLNVDIDRRALTDLVGAPGGDGSGGHLGLLRILIYALIALSPVLAVAMSSATAAIVAFTAALAGAAGAAIILGAGLFGLVKRFQDTDPSDYTPAMQQFADAITSVKDAWSTFLDGIETEGYSLMAYALEVLASILPDLVPLFEATAEAMAGVLDGIVKFIDSPEYKEMLDFFGGFGVDMLVSFLSIGGNLLQFFGRLFQAIEPFAREMMGGLEDVTAGWAAWADDLENNDSFQKFMANASEYGPMVLDMLGSLLQAFIAIGEALQPFAGPMLQGLTFLFDAIANAPTEVLTAIIAGLAGLWLGMSVILPLVSSIAGGIGALGLALGIATGPLVLIIAGIAALAAMLVYLWNTNETFRNALIDTWNMIVETVTPIVQQVVALIRDNWGPIKSFVMGIWDTIAVVIEVAMLLIRNNIRAVTTAIRIIWNTFGDTILKYAKGVFGAIGTTIKGMFQTIRGIFQIFKGILTGDWSLIWTGIKNFVGGQINTIKGMIMGIVNTGRLMVNGTKDLFNGLIGFFRGLPGRVSSAVSGMFNGIRENFRGVVNDIIGWWNNLSFSINIPDKIPGLPDEWNIDTPNVNYLAKGGYVTDPILAVVGEGMDNEVVAPEPVLERIVRENSGGSIDYGRLAAAIAAALGPVLAKLGGGLSIQDIEAIIASAAPKIDIDARSDHEAAGRLASAIGFELRLLGYGGKANV